MSSRIWGKDHNKLDDLARGVENLNKIRNTAVRHRLALLAWSTFFAKPAKDSINMTGEMWQFYLSLKNLILI